MRTKLSALGLLILLVLASSSAWCQTLRWETNLPEAARQAAASNRLVLVHFWAPWCVACRKMEQELFSQPDVQAAIDADYVAVQLNVDHNRPIAQQYGITELPTDIVVAPDGRLLDRRPGFVDRYQYVARLRQIAVDARRTPVTSAQASPVQGPEAVAWGGVSPNNQTAGAWPPAGQMPVQGPVQTGLPGSGVPAMAEFAQRQAPPADYRPAANIPAPPSQPPMAVEPPADAWVGPPPGTSMADGQPGPDFGPGGPVAPNSEPVVADGFAPPDDSQACPFALDGYCPVELVENKAWKLGDLRYGANHRGRTYLFAGPEQQQRFLQDPDRFSPAASGIDVVLLSRQQVVPGRREYGVFCANRVFLFASEETLSAFRSDPEGYLARLQATDQASQRRGTYR